ncbi:MAG: hypothetical protein AAGA20_15210 [Planctomycetota bacterium]
MARRVPRSKLLVLGSALLPLAGSSCVTAPDEPQSLPFATNPAPSALGMSSVDATANGETPWRRFGLAAGGVLAGVDSSVRLGLQGVGVEVDLEDALDLDSSTTTLRAELFWRYTENKRHRVDLSWVDVRRNSSTELGRDIDLGNGTTLPLGSQVSTTLNLSILALQYSYSFFQDERFDLALSGGLYITPIDFSIRASGASEISEDFDVAAPLPVVGLRMDFALTPRWSLRSDLSVFYLEIADYTGSIVNWISGVEYQAWDHVALGLAVDSFSVGVDQEGTTDFPGVDQAGSVNFDYLGLFMYLKTAW